MPSYLRYAPNNRPVFITCKTESNRPILIEHRGKLHRAFATVRQRRPFEVLAIVLLPDHFHLLMRLPEGDENFSTRIGAVKALFSKTLPRRDENVSASRASRRERGVWQRRFWEHLIRDEDDFKRHLDYIHYNPVKHGYAKQVADWPYSTFHRYVEAGVYDMAWAGVATIDRNARVAGE